METAYTMIIRQPQMKRFEEEIKLLVNQRLYDKGCITSEMYSKAKTLILRTA